jgi:hypothetical protein
LSGFLAIAKKPGFLAGFPVVEQRKHGASTAAQPSIELANAANMPRRTQKQQ